MAAMKIVAEVLVLMVLFQDILAADFDYSSTSGKGPSEWKTKFSEYCGKSRQSPVNIDVPKTNYDSSLGAITYTGYLNVPQGPSMEATNNGHSFSVTVKPNTFSISKGGLPGTYSLHSFHFHWGSKDEQGSEHTVNNKKYAAELHLVHFNTKYENLTNAVTKSDGLAVLGVLLQVGKENAALQSFLKYAENVTLPHVKLPNLVQTKPLMNLLPANKSHFYRYDGSLTTPKCNEVVTWTVFENAATISQNQLKLLRDLKVSNSSNSSTIVDNFRPVQPLNGRVIKVTFKVDGGGPDNGAHHVTNHVEIGITLIMAAIFMAFV